MLVLSRKRGEGIVLQVGGRIVRVILLEGKAKIGVEAEKDVQIIREELLTGRKDVSR